MPQATVSARTKAPDLRQRDLMNAGERIFVRQGVASTTIDDITGAAGVAKGTFYLYFDSKEDLLEALRDRFRESCRKRIERLARRVAPSDWAGRLDAWVEGGMRESLDRVQLHEVLFHSGEQKRSGSRAQSALIRDIVEIIRAGSAAGAWQVESPELVSIFLFYALHGVADYVLSNRRLDRKSAIRLSQRIARNTLGVAAQADFRPALSRA